MVHQRQHVRMPGKRCTERAGPDGLGEAPDVSRRPERGRVALQLAAGGAQFRDRAHLHAIGEAGRDHGAATSVIAAKLSGCRTAMSTVIIARMDTLPLL